MSTVSVGETAELVNIDTGEVISHADVRESIQRAKQHVGGFWQEVAWQIDHQAWTAIGHKSFEALWIAEYEALDVAPTREVRPIMAAKLRGLGWTQTKIAGALSAGIGTINGDLKFSSENEEPIPIANSRGQQRPTSYQPRPTPTPVPGAEDDEVVEAELVEDETPPRPTPEPRKQRRRPITDAFWDTRYDLHKRVETLHRLTEDDRWGMNAEKVAETNLNDLLRTRDLLEQVIQQLQFN